MPQSLLDRQLLNAFDQGSSFEEISEMFDIDVAVITAVIGSQRQLNNPSHKKVNTNKLLQKSPNDNTITQAGEQMRNIFKENEEQIARALVDIATNNDIEEVHPAVRANALKFIAEVNLGQKPDKAIEKKNLPADVMNNAMMMAKEAYERQIRALENQISDRDKRNINV